jgi:opacity protein-like surface antigen
LAPAAGAQDLERIELSLNAAGVFSKTAKSNNGVVSNTPTQSLAVLGSVQYHFTRMHSVELSISHTNNSQIFVVPPNTYRISTAVTEYSGAYVFSPFESKKWEPFLLGGVGGLRFSPGNTFIDGFQAALGAGQQTSLAFVYGGGADYHLWRRLNLRLQYRGFLYKTPDFNVQPLFTGARGHLAEPSIGIAVKF